MSKRIGTRWEVAKAGRFYMMGFDECGNRDHYDYIVYDDGKQVAIYEKTPLLEAMKKFKAVLREAA